jgi:hypothetical protein
MPLIVWVVSKREFYIEYIWPEDSSGGTLNKCRLVSSPMQGCPEEVL